MADDMQNPPRSGASIGDVAEPYTDEEIAALEADMAPFMGSTPIQEKMRLIATVRAREARWADNYSSLLITASQLERALNADREMVERGLLEQAKAAWNASDINGSDALSAALVEVRARWTVLP